jgi:hypothetical protein
VEFDRQNQVVRWQEIESWETKSQEWKDERNFFTGLVINFDRMSLCASILLNRSPRRNVSQPFCRMEMVFQLILKEQHVIANVLIKDILLPDWMMRIVCMMVNCPIVVSSKHKIRPRKHSCNDMCFSIVRPLRTWNVNGLGNWIVIKKVEREGKTERLAGLLWTRFSREMWEGRSSLTDADSTSMNRQEVRPARASWNAIHWQSWRPNACPYFRASWSHLS